MKNKTGYISGGIIILAAALFIIARMPKKQAPSQKQASTAPTLTSPAPADIQNAATAPDEDPGDIVPGLYQNPIQNTAAEEGFVITDSKVENNEEKNGKAVDDHLELTLKNTASKDLSDFEVYYLITDATTGQKEGYYKKLAGFVLKSGEVQAIHFDNGTEPGHFKANKDSLFYKSPNQLTFDVSVSAAGYKIQTVQISKDAGGAEQAD